RSGSAGRQGLLDVRGLARAVRLGGALQLQTGLLDELAVVVGAREGDHGAAHLGEVRFVAARIDLNREQGVREIGGELRGQGDQVREVPRVVAVRLEVL